MTMAPVLTVGYSCLAERLGNIEWPDVPDDVELLVAVQGGEIAGLPDGVRSIQVDGRGVARSRNAVIGAATARYLLFCDDDVVVDVSGVRAALQRLAESGHAVALGRGVDPTGRLRKSYPRRVRKLTRYNSGRAATYEMLIDVAQVRAAGLRFDERFGAGAPLHLADEYVFLADLLKAGLTGIAVPEVFGCHPEVSSGSRWGTVSDAHARAVAINRVFGRWAPIVRLAFAVKQRRRLGSVRSALRFVANHAQPPSRPVPGQP